MVDCANCIEKCPQAAAANDIAKGRMYATQEFIRVQKELERYQKAEAEGRLLVLPCKVGDTVYWIKGKAILEVYIQWFETNAYGWCACGTYPPMATPTFRFADFGKTVFLSREEAEAALGKERDADAL